MGKKYKTRAGRPVRILTTDLKGRFPVVAVVTETDCTETLLALLEDGTKWPEMESVYDLFEVTPYDGFKIGEPVMAKLFPTSYIGLRRYFAGVTQDGRPMVFNDGLTAWSSAGNRTICFSVRRPTEEELA